MASMGCAIALASMTYATPADPGSHRLVLGDESTLKDVFDVGLRPRLLSRQLHGKCETGAQHLNLSVAGGAEVPISVQNASFSVVKDYSLSSAEFTTEILPIPEAVALIKRFCASVEMPSDKLDAIAGSVGNLPDETQGWFNARRIGRMDVAATFYPMFRLEGTTHAQCFFSVTWRFEPGAMRFFTEPMQPPPGYENESMEPLPFKATGPPSPDPKDYPAFVDRPPEAKADMIRWAQEHGFPIRSDPSAAKPPPAPQGAIGEAAPSGVAHFRWWHWIIAAFALVLLGAIFCRRRRA